VKVIIDEAVCIGCETCAEMCPEVFRMDPVKEKAAVFLAAGSAGNPVRCIEEAMEACPVSCIHWVEE
jgi:ferredoxin